MLALCIESSHARGMGHLFRALALAEGLRQRDTALTFFLNDHPAAQALIASRGFAAHVVPLDKSGRWEQDVIARHAIDIWVNDRLDTDLLHAQAVRQAGVPMATFDDRGPGAQLAEINIAALVFDDPQHLPGRKILQGSDYLVLTPDIGHFRRVRTGANSIIVSMGGSDTWGVTLDVVSQLALRGKSATVVAGPGFAHMDQLRPMLSAQFSLKQNVPSLMEEFHAHDIAITGGGVTPFEAAAAGLPTIIIASESFEVPVGRALAATGASIFAGYRDAVDWSVLDRPLPIETMSLAGMERIGLTGRERVVDAILAARHPG